MKLLKLYVLLSALHLLLFVEITKSDSHSFSDADLQYLNIEQDRSCPQSLRCSPANYTFTPAPILDENGVIIEPPPILIGDGSCCGNCSCDLERCFLNGTCCPDTLSYLPSVEESEAKRKVTCDYGQFRLLGAPETDRVAYWMFRKCADDFNDADISYHCEKVSEMTPPSLNLSHLQPATDPSTLLTYQNVFCAICNHVPEPDSTLVFWDMDIECNQGIFIPGNIDTIIDDIMATESCNIVYKASDLVKSAYPESLPICEPVIDRCNVTGNWKTYDPFIDAACHAYEDIFAFDYRNVFCYLCNEISPIPNLCQKLPKPSVFISFSAILNVQSRKDTAVAENPLDPTSCSTSQVWDPLKNKCRDSICLPPKTYTNGTCDNILTDLFGLYMAAFIKVTPLNVRQPVEDLDALVSRVRGHFYDLITATNSFFNVLSTDIYYSIQLETEDDLQNPSISIANVIQSIEVYSDPRVGANLLPFIDGVLQLDNTTETLLIDWDQFRQNQSLEVHLELDRYYHIQAGSNGKLSHIADTGGNMFSLYWDPRDKVQQIEKPGDQVILITKTNACPLIDITDYTFNYTEGKVYVSELHTTFRSNVFIQQNNGQNGSSLLVCRDHFLAAVDSQQLLQTSLHVDNGTETVVSGSSRGILSLVCSIISLVCLLFSLLTYSLFRSLRTQPGINNMGLIVSLICAQSMYQFGIGQSKYVPEWGCTVIGVLIHFLWLTVMFWMNVCSFHMFQVFRKMSITSNNERSIRTTVIYTVYCLFASGIFVAINIIVSHVRSNGNHVGYGGNLCYISDFYMTMYTFVIPVALVVTLNLVLFITVIVKIARLPAVQNDSTHERNYFKIYAKLSSITGIAWLFGFLVYTNIEVFEYLFIIFTACQGVFIFFSFVFNRRVLNLYTGLCGVSKSSKGPSSGGTSSSKVTSTTGQSKN